MSENAIKEHLSDIELDQEYQIILDQLTPIQYRFIVARLEEKSDFAAARVIGIDEKTPGRWPEKKLIDRALQLAARDGVVLALTMRRKALPRAMAVKISGLQSDDERIRQSSSTEIIEGELGKPNQPISGKDGGAIEIVSVSPKLVEQLKDD